MKLFTTLTALSMLFSMSMLVGVALADDGVGVCAAGTGAEASDIGAGVYVGVNVGTASETNVFDNSEDFQTQCCAETGQEPDCFAPVG